MRKPEWRNRTVILNRPKDYYENNKERLREQTRDKYRNLSEEEKNKKTEYEKKTRSHLSEEKKQRLKEYQKNYREAKKSPNNKINKIVLLVYTTIYVN